MPDPKDIHKVFCLTEEDIPALQETWELSGRTVSERRFEVARKRLEHSVAEGQPEDRLIDEWIALEALFLKSGEKSEIAYRASFRIARYLGVTFEERKAMRALLQKSYEHRSEGGVHGSAVAARTDKPVKQQDLIAKEAETARLLRFAIRQCLRDGMPPDIGVIEDGFLKQSAETGSARIDGQTIGPRSELIAEMRNTAGVGFHLYAPDRFLEFAQKDLGVTPDPEVISEARDVSEEEVEHQRLYGELLNAGWSIGHTEYGPEGTRILLRPWPDTWTTSETPETFWAQGNSYNDAIRNAIAEAKRRAT